MKRQKMARLLVSLLGLAQGVSAATNDLSSALQKGLFEEEANHDFSSAIAAYQSVVSQYDENRKLAATAVFRLGECYRKRGDTNDATAEYERILRDFSDQSVLVALSRQNLTELGRPSTMNTLTGSSALADQSERTALDAQLHQLESLPKEQARIAIQQDFPNPVLNSLMQKLVEAEQKFASVKVDYGPQHAEVVKAAAVVETINNQIDAQVEAVLRGLKMKLDAAKRLETRSETSTGDATASTSSEVEEIKRIQTMITDSPDLINAQDHGTGGTPLHSAAGQGKLQVAAFLLANGANVEARIPNFMDRTPLHFAADNGHKAMVELLLSKGANVQDADSDGKRPCIWPSPRVSRACSRSCWIMVPASMPRTSTGLRRCTLQLPTGSGRSRRCF
jgi:hypothetical protein